MKPFVLPASTSLAAVAGAISILICMVLAHFGLVLTIEQSQAITVIATVAAGHFTTDSPPAPVAREAVSVAADEVDAAAAAKKEAHDV